MELKTCDRPREYYDIVQYGCLHNTTYDAQCEGDRGWYLYQAALCVGKDRIEKASIERYAQSFTDDWLFNQLTSLLYQFAANGSQPARTALYDKYNGLLDKLSRIHISGKMICNTRDMFDWLCVWLTSLDGWSAFKKIVNEVSERLIPRDNDFYFSEWFYDNSKGKFGKKRVDSYLSKQAVNNEYIQYYWNKAQEWGHRRAEDLPTPTLEEVITGTTEERFKSRWLSMCYVRDAGPNDLENLFYAAMSEQNLQKRAEILWGLRRAKHPIPQELITQILDCENEDIREIAISLMEDFPSPQVREYAISLLEKGEDTINAVRLLSKNMTNSDEELLCHWVKSIPVKINEGEWHSAFMSGEKGLESLRGKPRTDLLQYIYHRTFCSCCRERVVKLMHKKKVLTDSILQECLYDSYSETQSFAKRLILKTPKSEALQNDQS